MNVVDHSNNDFVEVGRVNGGVSLTEMRVNEEEVIVGKKDGIPSTTSSESQKEQLADKATPSVDTSDNTAKAKGAPHSQQFSKGEKATVIFRKRERKKERIYFMSYRVTQYE
jgi:hypothetical protein